MSFPIFTQFPSAVDYRSIAQEHQRKANIALARAQQQEELLRRRRRQAELEAELASLYEQEENERQYRRFSTGSPFDAFVAPEEPEYQLPIFPHSRPASSYSTPRFPQQQQRRSLYDAQAYRRQLEALRLEQERRERLEVQRYEQQRREQQRREQLSRKRQAEEELERQQRAQEDAFASLLRSLLPALAPEEPQPARKVTPPALKPAAQPAPRKLTKDEELARKIWHSFAGTRTDEDKAMILKELGLPVPPYDEVSARKATATPAPQPATPKKLPAAEAHRSSAPFTFRVRFATPEASSEPKQTPAPESPTTKQHTLLSKIASDFNSLKSSFAVTPSDLEFTSESTADAPILTYTKKANTSVHQYEQDLIKLLYNLDAVESDGKEEVREERKKVVRMVEAELDRLDKIKKDAWVAQHPVVAEPSVIDIPLEEVTVTPLASQEESSAMAVDEPVAVKTLTGLEDVEELEVAASVAIPEEVEVKQAESDSTAEPVETPAPVESIPEDVIIAEDAPIDLPATPTAQHPELLGSPSAVSEVIQAPFEETIVLFDEVSASVEESLATPEPAPVEEVEVPEPEVVEVASTPEVEQVPVVESVPSALAIVEAESQPISVDPVVIEKRKTSVLTLSSNGEAESSDAETDSERTRELRNAPVDQASEVVSLPSSSPKSSPKYHVTVENDVDADFEML